LHEAGNEADDHGGGSEIQDGLPCLSHSIP
jgi:hypothetical protein